MRFEWDVDKDQANKKKHHVSFDEAATVFADPNARLMGDPEHSDEEDRFVILGMSLKLTLLVVCHCYRENEEVIRIISAREATKKETDLYRRLIK